MIVLKIFNCISCKTSANIGIISDLAKCLNTIINSRKELIILMQNSNKSITVHLETVLLECFQRFTTMINETEQIFHKSTANEKSYIFYNGIFHMIFEALYVLAGCLEHHKNNIKPCLGPCPHLLLKLSEKLTHLLYKALYLTRDHEKIFLFQLNDQYKSVISVISYFSSISLINHFSCNCMGLGYGELHISNDTEIGHIILGGFRAIIDLCKMFQRTNIGEYFVRSNEINKCLDILIDTLLHSQITIHQSTDKMIATGLVAIHSIFSYLLVYYQTTEINNNIINFTNYEFVSFLCISSTYQYSVSETLQCIPLSDKENKYSFEIQKESLILLSILCPLFKSEPRFIVAIFQTRLPSRLVILLQKSKDPHFIDIICQTVINFCKLGFGGAFCKNNMQIDLEKLEERLGIDFNLVRNNVHYALNELSVDSSAYAEEWFKTASNQSYNHEKSFESSPNIPWLNSPDFQTNSDIKGVPSENSQNLSNLPIPVEECIKSELDSSIFNHQSNHIDTSDDTSHNNDTSLTLIKPPLPFRKPKISKNMSLNISRDVSKNRYKLDKSTIKKFMGKSFQSNNNDSTNTRGLWSYMSNIFRNKPKPHQK